MSVASGIPKGLDLYKHLLSIPPGTTPDNKGGGRKPGFPALQGVKCLHIGVKRETCHDDIRTRRGFNCTYDDSAPSERSMNRPVITISYACHCK